MGNWHDATVKELHEALGELVEQGKGDYLVFNEEGTPIMFPLAEDAVGDKSKTVTI